MKQKFLLCKHCGNIVAMIRDKDVPILFCGEKMQELNPGMTESLRGKRHPGISGGRQCRPCNIRLCRASYDPGARYRMGVPGNGTRYSVCPPGSG